MHRLRALKHLALDLDGTLYLGGRLFPSTRPFLQRIADLGLGRTFFTNNSSVSTDGYVQKLRKLGIDATADDLFSSTSATLVYLRTVLPAARRLFVLGTPDLRREFAAHGYDVRGSGGAAGDGTAAGGSADAVPEPGPEPDAVVVGFDPTLDYDRLCRATYWISRGKPFVATNGDAVCPTDRPTVLPDCGAVCKLLAHATGREPDAVCGKPAPGMLAGVTARHDLAAAEVAVVGDRLYTDIAMAQAGGAVSVLVLSGEATAADAAAANPPPDFVVQDVGELAELLTRARRPDLCRA